MIDDLGLQDPNSDFIQPFFNVATITDDLLFVVVLCSLTFVAIMNDNNTFIFFSPCCSRFWL